jgi:hypothetical protein
MLGINIPPLDMLSSKVDILPVAGQCCCRWYHAEPLDAHQAINTMAPARHPGKSLIFMEHYQITAVLTLDIQRWVESLLPERCELDCPPAGGSEV